jgi:hypothetical protein
MGSERFVGLSRRARQRQRTRATSQDGRCDHAEGEVGRKLRGWQRFLAADRTLVAQPPAVAAEHEKRSEPDERDAGGESEVAAGQTRDRKATADESERRPAPREQRALIREGDARVRLRLVIHRSGWLQYRFGSGRWHRACARYRRRSRHFSWSENNQPDALRRSRRVARQRALRAFLTRLDDECRVRLLAALADRLPPKGEGRRHGDDDHDGYERRQG